MTNGPRANVTRGSGVTRADPGKRDPGLRGYPAKRKNSVDDEDN